MTKQSENGSEAIPSVEKMATTEIVDKKPSEVRVPTPENKTSEGAPKEVDPTAIMEIIKKIIDLFKIGKNESEAFPQIQASNQNIQLETLQMIFRKTAEIYANIAKTPTPKSGDLPKDPIEELAKALTKVLEDSKAPKSSDLPKNPIEELAQALVKALEDSKAPERREGELDKNKAPDKVTGARGDKNELEPQQTSKNPVNTKQHEESHVQRLQTQRQQDGNEKSGGGGRG